MPGTWIALTIAIVFLVPGFLADFLLGIWLPRAKRESAEVVLTALLFTLVSFIPIALLVLPAWVQADRQGYRAYARDNAWALAFVAIIALIALPVLEAIIVGNLLRWPRFVTALEFLGLRVRLSPKAWDFVWGQDRRFLAVVTFTDGSRVGAGWAGASWASGFPNEEDVYFEVVYSLTDAGRIKALVPQTAGLLLKRADIQSIELIDLDAWEATDESERQRASTEAGPLSDPPANAG